MEKGVEVVVEGSVEVGVLIISVELIAGVLMISVELMMTKLLLTSVEVRTDDELLESLEVAILLLELESVVVWALANMPRPLQRTSST